MAKPRTQYGDYSLTRLQDDQDIEDRSKNAPDLGGAVLDAEFTSAGVKDIPHSLGRTWANWRILSFQPTATLLTVVSEAEQTRSDRFIRLQANAACKIRLFLS